MQLYLSVDQEVTEICALGVNLGVKFIAFLLEKNIGIYITRESRDTMVEQKDLRLSPLMKTSKSQRIAKELSIKIIPKKIFYI